MYTFYILGFNINKKVDLEKNWVSVSDRAYEIAVGQANYRIIPEKVNERIEVYKTLSEEEKQNYYIVTVDCITNKVERTLEGAIKSKIEKQKIYCKMLIEDGIIHTLPNGEQRHYTYKAEDQLNFNELKDLVDNNVFDTVLLKAAERDEDDELSIEEFTKIYYKLIYNKFYQLCYLREYKKYVQGITDINTIHRLAPEIILPKEYSDRIDKQLEKLKALAKE